MQLTKAECPCCGGEGHITIPLKEYARMARMVKGWTLQEAADETGINYLTIKAIESGVTAKPHFKTIMSLLDAYGIEMTDAMGELVQ